jgi:2-(3-amino-3-carboxypropyl)histidine synthase
LNHGGPLLIVINEDKLFSIIDKRKPRTVALNGPDGLASKIYDCALKISERYKIPAYIIGDSSWGSCDLNIHAAEVLGVDILFNIGHTISLENFGEKVVMIDAYDDIDFTNVAQICARQLKEKGFKAVSLVTFSQHLKAITYVKEILESSGLRVILGGGKGQLNDAQIFGCEFYPAFDVKDVVDGFVVIGQSMFHSASVAISTQKPTFMLDPYFNECQQVNDIAYKMQKKALLSVFKAMDADNIGIIIGLKEGQFAKIKALELKKSLESLGKKIQLIAMTDITHDQVLKFAKIDAFIQVACPRLGTDNHFEKPMLSIPQATTLIRLLKKEPVENFMESRHWL